MCPRNEAKVTGKFAKLSEIGFSIECLALEFSRFSITDVKNWVLADWRGTRHQIQEYQGFS